MRYTNNSIGYDGQHLLSYEDVVTIGAVSHEIAVNKDSATTQHTYHIPEGANVTGISLKGRLITSVGYTSQGTPFEIEKFKTPMRRNIYSYDGIPSRRIIAEYVIDNASLTINITSSIEGGNDTGAALKTSMAVVEATVYYTIAVNDINFTSTNISIVKPVSFGGDVSIGGSLTVPSDKGITADKLTGGKIDISTMTGGIINIGAMKGGSIDIKYPKVNTTDTSYFGDVNFDFSIDSRNYGNLIRIEPHKLNSNVGLWSDEVLETNSLYLVILKYNKGKLLGGLFYYDDALDLSTSDTISVGIVLDSYPEKLDKMLIANFNTAGCIGFCIQHGAGYLPIEDAIVFKLPISLRIGGWNNALS